MCALFLAPLPAQTSLHSLPATDNRPSMTYKTNMPSMYLSRPDTYCAFFFSFLSQIVSGLAFCGPLDSVQMSPSEKALVCVAEGNPPAYPSLHSGHFPPQFLPLGSATIGLAPLSGSRKYGLCEGR